MQGVTVGAPRNLHQLVDAEIAFARWRRADGVGFLGQSQVQRGPIRVAINRHGSNAHFPAGTDDTHGDFAAIGDKNFSERGRHQICNAF